MRVRGHDRPVFPRFSELSPGTVNRDLQVHTTWTDGTASVGALLQRADELQLAELAFTEHARATSDYFPAFFEEVRRLRQRSSVRVYAGFELKVVDLTGRLDATDDMLEAAELVLGSVHTFPGGQGRRYAKDLSPEEAAATELELSRAMLQRGKADVLAHCGGMSLRAHGSFPEDHFVELMRLCTETGTAFEINASYHEQILDALLELLRVHDPPVSIGSDAHALTELGRCRDLLRTRLTL